MADEPHSDFRAGSWGLVAYEYGLELHCPTCSTPIYFDGRWIALDDVTDAADAHRCPITAESADG